MIGWMQKHRKYLVVTIWISTIAFVGAGFVGWGAYSFNKSGSSIAKVGDRTISVKDMQFAYSNAYNNINKQLQGTFTKEQANKMNLEQQVLNSLINEELLLNYADDIGLKALDDDVKNKLANSEIFQVDGEFNLDRYNLLLRDLRLTANEYESKLKRSILLEKLDNVVKISPKVKLTEMMASSLFMEDRISIDVIQINIENIDVNDSELKAYWEPIKDNFKTEKTYDVLTKFVPSSSEVVNEKELKEFYEESKFNYTDSDGKFKSFEDSKDEATNALKLKLAKKSALKKYIKIKNREENLTKKESIKNSSNLYPVDLLAMANPNDVLKPFEYKDGYMIAQLDNVNMPKTKSFEDARDEVLFLYRGKKAQELLEKKSKDSLANFNGTDVGFVSRDTNSSIQGLTFQETKYFTNKLFDNNNKQGYVLVGDKSVVYNILEQNLLDNNRVKKYNDQLTQLAANLQYSQLQTNLLVELKKRYKIEQYYKGK